MGPTEIDGTYALHPVAWNMVRQRFDDSYNTAHEFDVVCRFPVERLKYGQHLSATGDAAMPPVPEQDFGFRPGSRCPALVKNPKGRIPPVRWLLPAHAEPLAKLAQEVG